MFDNAVAEPFSGCDDRVPADTLDELFAEVPDDGLDASLERLLDEAEQVPSWVPDWVDDAAPAPTYGNCAPSGWLALDLDTGTADPAVLSDTTLIEGVIGFDRMASWAGARQARLLAELLRRRPRDPVPNEDRTSVGSTFAPDEVGVALRLSRGAATGRIGMADRLLRVLPDTHALWEAGQIDLLKARAIDEATLVLSDEKAGKVEARVLPKAPDQTLAQLKAALARAVLAVDPDGAAERHRQARKDRRVCLGAESEGMASLWALLSAPDAAGAYQWLTRLARGLGPEDPRGIDARRADLLVALLTGQLIASADISLTDDLSDGDTDATGGIGTDTDATGTTGTGTTGTDAVTDLNCTNATGTGTADAAVGDTTTGTAAGQDLNPGLARPTDSAAGSSPTGSSPAHSSPTGSSTAGSSTAVESSLTGSIAASKSSSDPRRVIRPVTPGKPLIQVVVPYSTLIGADDLPADLAGYGPIPAELAREIAADGVWRRLVTDPLSGTLLDHGRTTYTPPAGLADHVRARDLYCRFPGCRRKAADAELDHIVAWADGGETSAANLHALCLQHHKLKHHAGWRIEAHPDGRLTWVTPTGHRHTAAPHDYQPEPITRPDERASTMEPGDPPEPGPDLDPDPPPF